MTSKILSLNVGGPQVIHWGDKSVLTSMLKYPVPQLKVSMTSIEGDSFASPAIHGIVDSVLYVFGLESIHEYLKRLGRTDYINGELGENITLDRFDENEISVGDRFQIGDVLAEATFPRIPCSRLNFRLQRADAQKTMIEAGRSGVYLRIIKPGEISMSDTFERVSEAKTRFTVSEVYAHMVGGKKLTRDVFERAKANGAFPDLRLERWEKSLSN